ncbi:MAG: FAD-binding oxidoreductase [Dehalococcoidia bacterium]|jgi:FAD/FMN-containing dehydrogenase
MIEDTLGKIVGAGNVSFETSMLSEYSKDNSFVNAVRPYCIVRPKNTGDIEKIVKLANETRTPLVPVSSGSPHFRGDTVPGVGGAIIVDLSGMKKIIRVEQMNRVAMFEPGVTFGELMTAVAKEGLRLNMPLLPRKSKSVIGSILEREPVVMPTYHWDIGDPLACVEIIFGNGNMFRTGAAAGPGTIEEQWAAGGSQKESAGPSSSSWYRIIQGSQGTMGIVTWGSVRCEIIPKAEEPFLVGSSQLDKLLDMAHWLVRLRMINECFILNSTNLASIMAKKWPHDYRKIKGSLPTWVLFFNIVGYDYFPEKRVSGQTQDMIDLAQRVGVAPVQAIGSISASELLLAIQHPSGEPYWKLRQKGACHDIFFVTIYDKLPGLLDTMYDAADEAGYAVSDMGVYLQPIVQGVNCHCEFNLFYDPANLKESDCVRELATSTVKKLMAKGAFFSRPYGESTDMIMNYDAATVAALRKIKSITDPLNVMNPGKLCF